MEVRDRILIIEDDRSIRKFFRTILEANRYDVISADTGEEGYSLITSQCPDLVILDLGLPDMDGMEILSRLRKWSGMPVVVISARSHEKDKVEALDLGADDYITKPFSLSVLVLKVNAFFKRYQKSPADELESGDLLFSMSRMSARKGQEDISFTKNEWKMLKLFLEHPKQILSKNQILEQLFDLDGEFADENTVAVNIRRLREKIEPDTAHPQYIRNIRGLGYIWDQNCQTRQRSSV